MSEETPNPTLKSHQPHLELGLIAFQRGQLPEAVRQLQQAIHASESPGVGRAYLALSDIYYEWNDLAATAQYIQQGHLHSQRIGHTNVQINAHCRWARLQSALGDAEATREAMNRAHALTRQVNMPSFTRRANQFWELCLAVNQQDGEQIAYWLQQIRPPSAAFHSLRSPLYVRALIFLKRTSTARALIELWLSAAIRLGQRLTVVQLLIQQALICETSPLPIFLDAMALAQPLRLQRTFLDNGRSLLPLLLEAYQHPENAAYVEDLILALHEQPTEINAQWSGASPTAQTPHTTLSADELTTLRQTLKGRSASDIAKSNPSARNQLHQIYRKLDAS